MPDASSRRVVITGAGLISPLGNTLERLWDGLSNGGTGIAELKQIPGDFLPTRHGAEASEFTGHIDDFGELGAKKKTIRKGLKVMCREIQMGVAAAQLALANADLTSEGKYDVDRTGVVYGSDYIMTLPDEFAEGVRQCLDDSSHFEFSRWAEHGLPKVTPLWLLKYLPNMPASHIAIYNDLRGPNNSITLREASANLAVAEAYATIARGNADTIVAGATGSRVHPLRTVHVSLQEQLATNGDDPGKMCRPFDLNRTGLVLGEGAGAVVVEELETARARGATILGEVIGYGSSTVVNRKGVADRSKAVENVLNQCLATAKLNREEIGHVHAHGLGTRKSDAEEAQAIDRVFADRESPPPVVAGKSFFGNLGAGSGIIELASSLLALRHGVLFPVRNFETPDPQCPVSPAEGGESPGDAFINLNVSPQGQASAVVVRRF